VRTILIGAIGSTEVAFRAMQAAGCAPVLLATYAPELGRARHSDFVDLAAVAGDATEVVHVESIADPDFISRVRAIEPDAVFVIGWSQIVNRQLREAAGRCIGFHPTLLPAMRGRAAFGWTILLGLRETGATLFEIDDGIDTGPILAQQRIDLDPRETVATLAAKSFAVLERLLDEILPRLADGTAVAQPQPEVGVTYCAKRTAADGLVEWARTADEIDRLVRAATRPYAGAFTFTSSRRVTIWAAEPYQAPARYLAALGQVVTYIDGDPVVLCGDGSYLRLTEYTTSDGNPLVGQVRLRARMPAKDTSV
jgi:methionyl-tRNA formyltransferase